MAWRILSLPLTMALMLLQLGCDRVDPPPGTHLAQSSASAKASSPAAPRPKPRPGIGNDVTIAEAASVTEQPRLIGLDQTQLRALLGPPQSESDRAPGKIWRYRNPSCALDVALYPAIESRSYRVLSYEVISDDSTSRGKRQCMAEFPVQKSTGRRAFTQ